MVHDADDRCLSQLKYFGRFAVGVHRRELMCKEINENEEIRKINNIQKKRFKITFTHGATHGHRISKQTILLMDNKIPIIYEFISSLNTVGIVTAVAIFNKVF